MGVRVLTARGWRALGADGRGRGAGPESPAPSWDQWGPASLSFGMARDPGVRHPDLEAFTPVEYSPPGQGDEPSWGGYIFDTPAAGEDGLTVNCLGHSYALDDDPYDRVYVHERLSDWTDARAGAPLGKGAAFAAGQVANDSGGIVLMIPAGTACVANDGVSVILDLGPDNLATNLSLDQVNSGAPSAGTFQIQTFTCNDPAFGSAVQRSLQALGAAPPGTQTLGPFSPASRYLVVRLICTTAGTPAGDVWLRITGLRTYTAAAYAAANQSVLKATDVLKAALARVPALDQSVADLAATTFSIRAFGIPGERRTPRQEMEAANDFHRYLLRFSPRGRLQFAPRFSTVSLEANTRRAGVEFVDATPNSGEDVYNKVYVTGADGTGAPLVVARLSTDVGLSNVLDRRGRVRSKELQVPGPTDAATMQALADAWLVRYARTPLKGTLTLTGRALRDRRGVGIPAGRVGPRVGELVSLSNLVDLDTGANGRVAITVGASYDEAEDRATVAIDNTRDDIDALLARLGISVRA